MSIRLIGLLLFVTTQLITRAQLAATPSDDSPRSHLYVAKGSAHTQLAWLLPEWSAVATNALKKLQLSGAVGTMLLDRDGAEVRGASETAADAALWVDSPAIFKIHVPLSTPVGALNSPGRPVAPSCLPRYRWLQRFVPRSLSAAELNKLPSCPHPPILKPTQIHRVLANRHVHFWGNSVTRGVAYALRDLVAGLPATARRQQKLETSHKQQQIVFFPQLNTTITFAWFQYFHDYISCFSPKNPNPNYRVYTKDKFADHCSYRSTRSGVNLDACMRELMVGATPRDILYVSIGHHYMFHTCGPSKTDREAFAHALVQNFPGVVYFVLPHSTRSDSHRVDGRLTTLVHDDDISLNRVNTDTISQLSASSLPIIAELDDATRKQPNYFADNVHFTAYGYMSELMRFLHTIQDWDRMS